MKASLLVPFLVLWLVSCENAQQALDPKEEQIDSLFMHLNRADGPGVAIGVIKNGEFVYKKYFGQANLNYDLPINKETVFNVASLSKQFTATCIHILIQRGQLSLADDIRKYLPDFPIYSKPITVEHLIHHTSGIRDYTELLILNGVRLFKGYDNTEALKMIYRQMGLNFEPGEKWMYSNSNYVLLKEIIEKVSCQPLEEFAKDNIFDPLGMVNTQYNGSHVSIVKNRATRYRKSNGRYLTVPDNDFTIGDGGVFSNLDDFLRWDQNFYNNKIASPDLIKSIEKPNVNFELFEDVNAEYASGLMIINYKQQKVFLHGGGDAGIQTGYFRFPDLDFSIISMANTNEYDFWGTSLRIADIYLGEFLKEQPQTKKEETTKVESKKIDLNDRELQEYVGYYFSEEVDYFIKIIYENGQLKMPDTNAPGLLAVTPIQRDYLQVGPGKAKFKRSVKGNIIGFVLDLDGGRVNGLFYEKRKEL